MIKDDKTKEKMKRIIRENPDKTLNELKNMIKGILPEGERGNFIFKDLKELISEINEDRNKEMQRVFLKRPKGSSGSNRSTINREGEER